MCRRSAARNPAQSHKVVRQRARRLLNLRGVSRFPIFALLVVALLPGCERVRRLTHRTPPSPPAVSAAVPPAPAEPAPSIALDPPTIPDPKADTSTPESKIPPPKGFLRMTVGGVAPTNNGNAVLLVDEDRKRALPIFVGETEALSIRLRLAKRHYARPLTYDLMESALDRLGAQVEFVRVDKIEDNVFFGTVILRQGGKRIELDARTSDAVGLALGHGAPIFVAKKVLDVTAVDLDRIARPDDVEKPSGHGEKPDGPKPDPHHPDPIAL